MCIFASKFKMSVEDEINNPIQTLGVEKATFALRIISDRTSQLWVQQKATIDSYMTIQGKNTNSSMSDECKTRSESHPMRQMRQKRTNPTKKYYLIYTDVGQIKRKNLKKRVEKHVKCRFFCALNGLASMKMM